MDGKNRGYMNKLLGMICSDCYMVRRGKSCAYEIVKIKKLKYVLSVIKKYDLKYIIQKLNNEWVAVFMYEKWYMKEVIRSLPDKPKTLFEHWVLGKAFGYSDEAISQFLETIN